MNLRNNEIVIEIDTKESPVCKFVVLEQTLGEDAKRGIFFDTFAVAFKAEPDRTVVLEVTSQSQAHKLVKLLSRAVSHVEIR